MKKKIISILLSSLIIFSVFTIAFADNEVIPVVFVPGYTASRMYVGRGTESEKRVWKIDVADELVDALKKEIPALLAGGAKALIGDNSILFKTLEPYAKEITEYLRINDDGTSLYDVEVYPHSVEMTRLDNLQKIGYYPDYDTLKLLKQYHTNHDVYCCTLDWRLGQIDNASVLNDYINDVLKLSGTKKVHLLGVSYGGQVVSSYLSLYGGDKVDKVILHCPALGGSSIVPQLFSDGKIDLAWSDILKLAMTFSGEEIDVSEITDIINPDFLNEFIKEFVIYYMFDLFLNFGSAWDLVPLDQYTELRNKLLDDGKHQEILYKTDKYHYEVAANLRKTFKRLTDEGLEIYIIAGYGYSLVTDNGMNSDTVIEISSTTGATCAEIGDILSTGYNKLNCGNPSHCHISADNCIDAATGYLPETTWYVKDMFHGLGTNEKITSKLMLTLLDSKSPYDVHSDTRYPQFITSDNPFTGVMCTFISCAQGYITPYSTEMIITNLSKESEIQVDGISAGGTELRFSYSQKYHIQPGESIKVDVSGVKPEYDLTSISIKIDYISIKDKYRVAKTRTQYFRYSDSSLYNEILDKEYGHSYPTISDTPSVITGRPDILSIFARLLYNFRKFIQKINNIRVF